MNKKEEQKLKKELRAKADRLWHLACLKKWGKNCSFHKNSKRAEGHVKNTDSCHHIYNKKDYGYLRYVLDNGLPVCWLCHNKLEQQDSSMIIDIVKQRGKKWYDRLKEKSQYRKTSFETISWYKENIDKLKEYLESGEN